MEKTFEPQVIEQSCYREWEQRGYFRAKGSGQPYCIMIPPPNVTGILHMGHGFQASIQDALTRYHRMLGDNTLWQVGTDHAGIATQMVVERQLQAKGQSRHDLGRDDFVKQVWAWKETSGSHITQQFRRLGISVDWSRERFTMDPGLSDAVTDVFTRLYDEGLIYRGKRLVNWDPVLQTAVSDLEVDSHEERGHLWHFRYPLSDGSGHIVIATTRPETLLGDTAVAVHPDDERYQHLIGKTIALPLCDREIPIVADTYVDPEFGTGCVKITPAHDFNDYEVGQRHNLPQINIFSKTATINDNAPEAYRGLDRFVAREKVVDDMQLLGLLDTVADHTLQVPRGDRTQSIIEPYLTDQWFVTMAPLAKPALDAVADGRIKFIPENWTKTYNQWLENIQDWCISRQLWWGHRIPAWYDADNNIYVARDEADVRRKYQLGDDVVLRRDDDVLDTWFSSALWPFSSLGWPEESEEFRTFYPTDVLVTGFDIIFFWVARMIMMGMHFTGDVPFHEVYITPLVRDAEGQKMSKSKGNALDPIDLIDGISLEDLVDKNTKSLMQPHMREKIERATRKQFPEGIPASGTDALRFTFCQLASPGRDVSFDLARLIANRNFCNKLWNASRFVLMNCDDSNLATDIPAKTFSMIDEWMRSRTQDIISRVHQHFHRYRFDLLCKELYEFIWHEYCDWYLELVKPVLNGEDVSASAKRGTRFTLVATLETILRLLHPIMPFITESIWQRVAPLLGLNATSIMLQAFPQAQEKWLNPELESEITWLKAMITAVRNIRGEMNIAPGKPIPLLLQGGSTQCQQLCDKYKTYLASLAKIESIRWLDEAEAAPASATGLVSELTLLVPLAGLIDISAESARLDKAIAKLDKDIQVLAKKLDNPRFIEKAPAEVVDKDRAQLNELRHQQATLQNKRQQLTQA